MLIYHPIHDVYHCVFRLLRLLESIEKKECQVDRLRILDFYLLFPDQLQKVAFPRSASGFKKRSSVPGPYEQIEDPYKVLVQLEPYQRSALGCLTACDLLDATILQRGTASRTQKALPLKLSDAVAKANQEQHDLVGLLVGPFLDIEFYGATGLKARTKLMEYRYD